MPKWRRCRQQISLLVPIGGTDPVRAETWSWLARYWRDQLPDAEIVIGRDRQSKRSWYRRRPKPFSKAAAINNAFRKSHGDIVILLDSDAYLPGDIFTHCAERLRLQRKTGVRSWFVPFDKLYRLTRNASNEVLESDPCHPLRFSSPPPKQDIDGRDGSGGPLNVFGAMCMIMPREAFVTVGGLDPRFRGWGAEDHAFVRALDTLWGPMKTTPNDILHLWHPHISSGYGAVWTIRMWENQHNPNINNKLAGTYAHCYGKPAAMRQLVDDGHKGQRKLR